MHSSINRAQAVFGFFTTVALFVAGVAALSALLYPAEDAKAEVELKNVQVIKGRPNYYSNKREEYAQLRFDLDADLTPLFNWNTKQLFVYVYASYSSDNENTLVPNSQSIVWDTIIPAPQSPYSFSALREKYFPTKPARKSKKTTTKTPKKTAEPGILRLRNQRGKYQISDITGKMAERPDVTLTVGWNVQPWVGALWWSPGSGAGLHTGGKAGVSKKFDFPALKGSKPVVKEGEKASSAAV